MSGFTLIELLLVITLITLIGIISSPIGISFYRSQLLNETSDGLVSALRQAQSFSMSGKNEHSYGVRILPDAYIIFEGDTYGTRLEGEDQIFPVAAAVTISGIDELVFSKFVGAPNTEGIISVAAGLKETQIEILPSGNIER